MQPSSFSWSWLRCSRSKACCLAYSSRCRLSISDMPPPASPFSRGAAPGAAPCTQKRIRVYM